MNRFTILGATLLLLLSASFQAQAQNRYSARGQTQVGGSWQEVDGVCAGTTWNVVQDRDNVSGISAQMTCGNGYRATWQAENIRWKSDGVLTYTARLSGGEVHTHIVTFTSSTTATVDVWVVAQQQKNATVHIEKIDTPQGRTPARGSRQEIGGPTSATGPAASNKLFENWNTGGCGYTDSSGFELRTQAHIDQIDVWYHWRGRESSVPYTISHDGQTIRTGTLHRAECDANQEAWCVARDSVDIDAGPGAYMVRTERPRVCQNSASGGAGFVKVFGQRTRRGR